MNQTELDFYEWLPKVSERIQLFNLHVKEKIDKISEEDWSLIECLHRMWYCGMLPPYYKTVPDMDTKTFTQVDLFTPQSTDNTSGIVSGIQIDYYAPELKKEEDEEDV